MSNDATSRRTAHRQLRPLHVAAASCTFPLLKSVISTCCRFGYPSQCAQCPLRRLAAASKSGTAGAGLSHVPRSTNPCHWCRYRLVQLPRFPRYRVCFCTNADMAQQAPDVGADQRAPTATLTFYVADAATDDVTNIPDGHVMLLIPGGPLLPARAWTASVQALACLAGVLSSETEGVPYAVFFRVLSAERALTVALHGGTLSGVWTSIQSQLALNMLLSAIEQRDTRCLVQIVVVKVRLRCVRPPCAQWSVGGGGGGGGAVRAHGVKRTCLCTRVYPS